MIAKRSDDTPQQHAARVSAHRRRETARLAQEKAGREARRSPGVDGHPTWCVCEPCETEREQRGDPRILGDEQ